MEQNVEILTTRPPLLNEYCLLEIFKYLKLDDAISFANCCKYLRFVANGAFEKFTHFRFHRDNLTVDYVTNVLSHIGPYISSSSLEILTSARKKSDISKFLKIIDSNCKSIKSLKIYNYRGNKRSQFEWTYNFESLESLTLARFHNRCANGFIQSLRNLKTLIVSRVPASDTMLLIQNNINITAFGWEARVDIDLRTLHSVLTLNFLTKLQLRFNQSIHFNKNEIYSFLRELAKKGIMEELVLECIEFDNEFFGILASFTKLRLLCIRSRSYNPNLKTSIVWPVELHTLRLERFKFTCDDVIDIVRQLESLECLDLSQSYFTTPYILHVDTVPRISEAVDDSAGNQCRKIWLSPFPLSDSEKFLIRTDRLEILQGCSSGFELRFQSYYKHETSMFDLWTTCGVKCFIAD